MNCRSCGQEIHFDNAIKSDSGKSIPLQGATGYDKHDCPNNPYKKGQAKQEFANIANNAVNSSFTDKNELARLHESMDQLHLEIKQVYDLLEATLKKLGLFSTAKDELEQ